MKTITLYEYHCNYLDIVLSHVISYVTHEIVGPGGSNGVPVIRGQGVLTGSLACSARVLQQALIRHNSLHDRS